MNAQPLKIKQPVLSVPEISEDILGRARALKNGVTSPARKMLRRIRGRLSLFTALALGLAVAYPNIKKYAVRIVIGLLIFDAALLSFNLFRVYGPLSIEERTRMAVYLGEHAPERDAHLAAVTPLRSEAKDFVASLEQKGLTVATIATVERSEFSVPGHIVTVNGDTLLIFEYPNTDTAGAEALAVTNLYANKQKAGLWDSRVHVYTKGSLVVFYLGIREETMKPLSEIAGNSLINNPVLSEKTLS